MTHYAGLDVSMKETSIAIMNEKGKIVYETVCESDPNVIAKALDESRYALEKIGLESGCLSFWLMDELQKLNVKTICIDSKQMATVIALKVNKTDRNDARAIADVMRCNLYKEVYLKQKKSIDTSLQMGARRTLVEIRTKLKNSVRGFLKAYGVRLGTVSHQNFPKSVRNAIKTCENEVQSAIEGLLKSYEEVCKNIEGAEVQLEQTAANDPIIQLFKTIPGVGAITATTYKAVIDDPLRFKNAKDVGAYLGLTPTQYSSGDSVRQGRISKCGCTELRTLLVECAHVLLTRTKEWSKLKAWGLKIMKRSGLKKATSAVARKLAIIMLRMWQEGKPFVWGEKKEKIEKTPASKLPLEEACVTI